MAYSNVCVLAVDALPADFVVLNRSRGSYACALHRAELKACKQFCDNMTRETNTVKVVEERLKAKPWGAGAVEYLQSKTAEQNAACDKLLLYWSEQSSLDPDAIEEKVSRFRVLVLLQ